MTNLRNALAGLFPTIEDSRCIVDDASLPTSHIAFNPAAITNWHNVVTEAKQRGKGSAIIAASLEENLESEELRLTQSGCTDIALDCRIESLHDRAPGHCPGDELRETNRSLLAHAVPAPRRVDRHYHAGLQLAGLARYARDLGSGSRRSSQGQGA